MPGDVKGSKQASNPVRIEERVWPWLKRVILTLFPEWQRGCCE